MPSIIQIPSTENNGIKNLHKYALNDGKQRNVQNFEHEFTNPWRTNGKAYINWVVGPKEVQQTNQSKYLSLHNYNYF
jgi:hypothetical protein